MTDDLENILDKLAKSKFRSSFHLRKTMLDYINKKGIDTIKSHAYDFINERLKPANIPNDGRQTPMKNHPVFVAQHATATCCRGCLEKWHHIPKGRELTETEVNQIVTLIMAWISQEMNNTIFSKELGHIVDADFGFDDLEKVKELQFAVRVFLRNEEGKICIVKSQKYGYIQLPGGGVEKGEAIENAVRRETREETGYELKELKPLGYFMNERSDVQVKTFVYSAKAGKDVGTDYTEDEIEDEFAPIWMDAKEVIDYLTDADERLAKTSKDKKNYKGTFATRRDLILTKYYLETKEEQRIQ